MFYLFWVSSSPCFHFHIWRFQSPKFDHIPQLVLGWQEELMCRHHLEAGRRAKAANCGATRKKCLSLAYLNGLNGIPWNTMEYHGIPEKIWFQILYLNIIRPTSNLVQPVPTLPIWLPRAMWLYPKFSKFRMTAQSDCCHFFQRRMTLESPCHSGSERRPSWVVWPSLCSLYPAAIEFVFKPLCNENGLKTWSSTWCWFLTCLWQFRPKWFQIHTSFPRRFSAQESSALPLACSCRGGPWRPSDCHDVCICLLRKNEQINKSINSRCKRLRGRSATIYGWRVWVDVPS